MRVSGLSVSGRWELRKYSQLTTRLILWLRSFLERTAKLKNRSLDAKSSVAGLKFFTLSQANYCRIIS